MSFRLSRADKERLVTAIGEAERGSRGEVRLHFEDRCPDPDTLERAKQLFAQLGMHRTRDGTAVLLYVAVRDRRVTVYAGAGIHGQAEPRLWQQVTDEAASGFARGDPVAGLVKALARIGDVLRERAPGQDDAGNELENQVTTS